MLLFLIPLGLIKNLIQDRRNYQREAISSITEPLGRNAEIQGLVIAVPYSSSREVFDSNGNKHVETDVKYAVFAPDTYNLDIEVKPYFLSRGIFKVPVFNGEISLASSFGKFDFSYFNIEEKDVHFKDSVLILGLSNTKTLTKQPIFTMTAGAKNEKVSLDVSPVKYESVSPFMASVFYHLPLEVGSEKLNISATIGFQGGENIRLRPIAQDNVFKMQSYWKSPSFSGGWLPTERNVSDSGFVAEWNVAGLSTVYPKSWLSGTSFNAENINVSFIVPVDSYKKTERSVKYALLFLLIPFIALMIAEIFSKTPIHIVQYCMIGFADVIFYLLLLSISEHLPFDLTYFICAFGVCAATLFYAISIFKNKKWGSLLTGIQFISYVFLYGTLQAEDYALLIGSIGLFFVVVLLMFITRKIDWYSLNSKTE